MKFFKFSDMKLEEKLERTPLIFFILFLVPEICVKRSAKWHQKWFTYCQNFSETLAKRAIFVISLGSGQLANYEIRYNLAITCNNQLKLCGQKVLQKRHKCIKVFVVKATVSAPFHTLYGY